MGPKMTNRLYQENERCKYAFGLPDPGAVYRSIHPPPKHFYPSTIPSKPCDDHSRCNDLQFMKLELIPTYLPKNMIKLQLPMGELGSCIERIAASTRILSIEATYKDKPGVTARLRTIENIELLLTFWRSHSGHIFYMNIQRTSGDCLVANQYIRLLLDAASGKQQKIQDEELTTTMLQSGHNQTIEIQYTKDLESELEIRIVSSQFSLHETTATTALGGPPPQVIMNVYEMFNSNKPKWALELLCTMTDLRCTVASAAFPTALAVLKGEASEPECDLICKSIQRQLMQTILDYCRELGTQVDNKQKLHPIHDVGYTRDMFQLALMVLVNAFEVAEGMQDQEATLTFLTTAKVVFGLDIIEILLQCLVQVESGPHLAYLATKALLFLGRASWQIHVCLKESCKIDYLIRKVIQVGHQRHALLFQESQKLWDSLYRKSVW